jgi:oxaloacetate decarboxylase alpha subunit
MISNLGHQLSQVGKESQLPQALEETSRVRVEFGYPIMVTPLSQFVGSQAAINVIVGERYKEVTDQVIRYALGHFGEEAITAMDQSVRDKILDRPRAKQLAGQGPAKPYVTKRHPLVKLMAELARNTDTNLIQVSKPGFALTLERKAAGR